MIARVGICEAFLEVSDEELDDFLVERAQPRRYRILGGSGVDDFGEDVVDSAEVCACALNITIVINININIGRC